MKNKMEDLNNALFVELETLQDGDSFQNEDGSLNKEKLELALRRADKVSDVAGRIMELQRLQVDVLKLADKMGYMMKIPESLMLEDKLNGNGRKALGKA